MDEKPVRRPAVKEGKAPKGMDIKAKLKKQAESRPKDKPEPDEPAEPKKPKGK